MGYCFGSFLAFGALLLIMRFTLLLATVVSQSMSPTLEIGDRVLAFRYWPHRWLRKGQIVIVRPTESYPAPRFEPFGAIPLIKRVTWVKGDLPLLSRINTQFGDEQRLPSDCFLVSGDLFILANDTVNLGVIPYENLMAIVLFKMPCQKNNQYSSKLI